MRLAGLEPLYSRWKQARTQLQEELSATARSPVPPESHHSNGYRSLNLL